ncbi:MAG: HDIG domain-containing protein [Duncaniella sp.]|nr:HDIG domain-containing protein [Duncaniella sp.]
MTDSCFIDKLYPVGTKRRDTYLKHCRQVADLALEIMRRKHLPLDEREVEEAAMLHDIGICLTDAPGIDCHGREPYIMHGVLGGKLLREAGFCEQTARVAERHTGAGIDREDIERQGLPLPPGNYMPESLLERLICYADKFYSKSGDMKRKPIDKVEASMARISPSTLKRFLKLKDEFE